MSLRPSIAARALQDVADPRLREFMSWYFDANDSIKLRPPYAAVVHVKGLTSIILFREGRFQVELVICEPGITIPPHVHPDVDSYEVAFSGPIELHVSGTQVSYFRQARPDGQSRDFGKYVPIPANAPHEAKAGDLGCSFMSIQRWRDGVEMKHVGLNWAGVSMGEQHDQAMRT